jgi:hypothetical protein
MTYQCTSPHTESYNSSYSSWIYDYLCNQCLSPITLWVRIPLRRGVLDTTLCDKVCQWITTVGFLRVLRFPPLIKHHFYYCSTVKETVESSITSITHTLIWVWNGESSISPLFIHGKTIYICFRGDSTTT